MTRIRIGFASCLLLLSQPALAADDDTPEVTTVEASYHLAGPISANAPPAFQVTVKDWSGIAIDEQRLAFGRAVTPGYVSAEPQMRPFRFGEDPFTISKPPKSDSSDASLDLVSAVASVAGVFVTDGLNWVLAAVPVSVATLHAFQKIVAGTTVDWEVTARHNKDPMSARGYILDKRGRLHPLDSDIKFSDKHGLAFNYLAAHVSNLKSDNVLSAFLFEFAFDKLMGSFVQLVAPYVPVRKIATELAGELVKPLVGGAAGSWIETPSSDVSSGESSASTCPPPIVISGFSTITTACMNSVTLSTLPSAAPPLVLNSFAAAPIYPRLVTLIPAAEAVHVIPSAPGTVTIVPLATSSGSASNNGGGSRSDGGSSGSGGSSRNGASSSNPPPQSWSGLPSSVQITGPTSFVIHRH